jgi:hypothetical protein
VGGCGSLQLELDDKICGQLFCLHSLIALHHFLFTPARQECLKVQPRGKSRVYIQSQTFAIAYIIHGITGEFRGVARRSLDMKQAHESACLRFQYSLSRPQPRRDLKKVTLQIPEMWGWPNANTELYESFHPSTLIDTNHTLHQSVNNCLLYACHDRLSQCRIKHQEKYSSVRLCLGRSCTACADGWDYPADVKKSSSRS